MAQKMMEKRMEAKTATLLKYMLEMELKRLKKVANIDILLFMGVDSRTFSSYIPNQLTPGQFFLLNMVKSNVPAICHQLKRQHLIVSIQKYSEGLIIISGVGGSAFLVSLVAKQAEMAEINEMVKHIQTSSVVIRHIFELKPITPELIKSYPADVQEELNRLSRLLFVEQFDQTRGYKKNMDVLEYIKGKLAEVIGVGAVAEVVTVTFNELGTTAPYMTDQLWMVFVEKVVKEHIKRISGDIVADECLKTWLPAVEKKIKSFV